MLGDTPVLGLRTGFRECGIELYTGRGRLGRIQSGVGLVVRLRWCESQRSQRGLSVWDAQERRDIRGRASGPLQCTVVDFDGGGLAALGEGGDHCTAAQDGQQGLSFHRGRGGRGADGIPNLAAHLEIHRIVL